MFVDLFVLLEILAKGAKNIGIFLGRLGTPFAVVAAWGGVQMIEGFTH